MGWYIRSDPQTASGKHDWGGDVPLQLSVRFSTGCGYCIEADAGRYITSIAFFVQDTLDVNGGVESSIFHIQSTTIGLT